MDQVFIHDLSVRGVIGIHDWERNDRQEIVINLCLFGDFRLASQSDQIEDCINYQTLADKVLGYAESAHRFTVEAFASDLAEICLAEPNVIKVRVRVEKPSATQFARSVGVEIERTK